MNVGDYVRYISVYNNEIKIRKINAIIPPDNLIEENYYKFNDFEGTIEKDIIKSSPNIIDLIEVGDYVNGHRVVEKQWLSDTDGEYDEYRGAWCVFCESCSTGYEENNIKSIVTREMFESMEYKVGD